MTIVPQEQAAVYKQLAAPFDETFNDVRGGVEITYITGEQAVTRLNEELGFANWSFRVLEHGFNQESDEFWVLAELTAQIGERTLTRQQFGSQKIKRSRQDDHPLDIGFDLKGASTDALKKCASLVGVGLYLSHKEARAAAGRPVPAGGASPQATGAAVGGPLVCAQCGEELKEVRFRDGTSWSPQTLAEYGRRKHGKVLCMADYREANAARKRAEENVAVGQRFDEVPF